MKAYLVSSLALAAIPALATAPNPGSDWKKTLFLDDFTGGSGAAPSSSNWIIQTGTQYPGGPAQWGTGEIETYTSSGNNVRQAGNGNLWIVPVKSSSGSWTSARIETRLNNFAAPAGGKLRIEASIAMPAVTGSNGLGYWPAFWMLGGDFRGNYQNWPAVGEIDIMEAVNGATTSGSTLHCGTNPNGPCNEPNGIGAAGACKGSSCAGNFHTYTAIIDRSTSPEQLQFMYDGVLVHTIKATDIGTDVWSSTMHKGFYVVLNVAMGGGYPNAVAGRGTPTQDTISGKQMAVDYVAVWST